MHIAYPSQMTSQLIQWVFIELLFIQKRWIWARWYQKLTQKCWWKQLFLRNFHACRDTACTCSQMFVR